MRDAEVVVALYADGGLVRRNPSPYAGTWAWCHVDRQGQIVARGSGIQPWDGTGIGVTNNEMEAMALIEGLESLPEGWAGRVCSDSKVALGWVLAGAGYHSRCPEALRARAVRATQRLGFIRRILMNGHPSANHLAAGIGARGLPCDQFQVWCDKECSRLANGYIRAHGIPKGDIRAHNIPKGPQRAAQGQREASGGK